jgi:hypothetical protein
MHSAFDWEMTQGVSDSRKSLMAVRPPVRGGCRQEPVATVRFGSQQLALFSLALFQLKSVVVSLNIRAILTGLEVLALTAAVEVRGTP